MDLTNRNITDINVFEDNMKLGLILNILLHLFFDNSAE